MGKITIQEYTTRNPISIIGEEAGVCWGADIKDAKKNYQRGLSCLKSQHGRTFEFPDVYMILDGYSAKVIREFYTHIGGLPTRLQASTRYIDYTNFKYVTPASIKKADGEPYYDTAMKVIRNILLKLEYLGVPKEDLSMLLPLGMTTKVVCKMNLRTLMEMSRQRMCSRAYWEFRELFKDISAALCDYSKEWKFIIKHYFMPKCKWQGYCTETNSCGKSKEER